MSAVAVKKSMNPRNHLPSSFAFDRLLLGLYSQALNSKPYTLNPEGPFLPIVSRSAYFSDFKLGSRAEGFRFPYLGARNIHTNLS